MRKNKPRIIIFLIISLLCAVVFSIIFVMNISEVVNGNAKENINKNTQESVDYLDSYVDFSYGNVNSFIKVREAMKQDDKTIVDALYVANDSNYLGFGCFSTETKENQLVATLDYYKGNNDFESFSLKRIRAERIFKQKASITKLSYIFSDVTDDETVIITTYNDKYFAIQSFSSYASLLSSPYGDSNNAFILVSKDGLIYENSFDTSTSLVSIFSDESGVSEIIASIDDDNDKALAKTINKEEYLVTYAPYLSEYNTYELYIFYFVSNEYLSSFSRSIMYSSLIFMGCFAVAIILFSLFLLIGYMRIKQVKAGFSLLPYDYDTQYVILVSGDGKIISKNKRFTNSKFNCKAITDLDVIELNGVDEGVNDLLKNSPSLTVAIKNAEIDDKDYIKFYIISTEKGYQLIGVDTNEKPYIPNINTIATSGANENGDNIAKEYAFHEDIYGVLNEKALVNKLENIIYEKGKNSKDLYFFYVGLRNREEIVKLYGRTINEMINFKLIEILKQEVEEEDLYFLNGDNVAFLKKLKDNFNALNGLMLKLNKRLKAPVKVLSNEIKLDVLIGIYPFSIFKFDGEATPKNVIGKAIFAYDRAFSSADRNYYLYDVNSEAFLEKEYEIANDIRNAIANDEFRTYFQPIYSLRDDAVKCFECLLRWDNDKYRYESPYEYIKIAEQTGLIHDIGLLTFRKSFEMMKKLNRDDLRISVNVSPAQFLQEGFTQKFIDMYQTYGVPYQCIGIEITETFLMDSMQEVVEKLQYIRSYGIKVYLDDFGTGYSSLLYLAELPVDIIKIDMNFTRQIPTNKEVRTILSHLLGMANELNIDIVAEGVETETQLKFYEKQGCNYLQGYYFSKAVPSDQVEKALEIKRKKADKK